MLVFFLLIVFSCNPGNNYQTLSFFFDGVPIPKSDIENSDTTIVKPESFKVRNLKMDNQSEKYIHQGYKKNECGSCHDVNHAYRLIERQPKLCYMCHENFNDQYKYLHGPVAAGYCTSCHHPHQSNNEYILIIEIEQLCVHCHEPGDVSKNPSHQNLSSVNCVSCHNSHGGETNHMLKPGIKTKS
jgi:predicted CXXCH cytochrome family protein